ncbi:MAG: insulinase family protein, partial [Myxococcales bacterium]|nr:insulinase family protein [Myxococcales bacterium]
EQPEAPATALSFGHVITPTRGHADFPALALAASYFGEHRQFQGVMFQRMRELRGMNYGDYAYAEAFSQEGWSRFALTNIARTRQHFSLWIRPVPNEDRHFAARITMYLLNEMLEKGLTPAQFEETRAFLNGYLYLQQQTDQRRLGTAIDDRFYGLSAPYADGLRAAWAKLDAAGVNDALRRNIHPEALTVVVITPNAQAFVDAVLAETPSPKTYPAEKPAALLEEDKVIEVLPLGFTREQVEIIPSSTLFAR